MSRAIVLFTSVLLIIVSMASLVPVQATGGVFPGEPFNGMQITYSVSGAEMWEPPIDDQNFTTSRTYTGGRLTGSVLRISGQVSQSSGFSASVSVEVSAGGNTNTYSNSGSTPWTQSFDVSVPIPPGATRGSFSVYMFGNYSNGETRGLVVSGSIDNNAPTPVITPTPTLTPTPTPTPAYDISIKAAEYTQAIQCLDQSTGATNCADNSVPLVKGKTTVLRLYPQVQEVSGPGTFPGAQISADLVLDSPGGGSVSPNNGPIALKVAPDRKQANDSLNYRLPAEWTQYGSISVHVELNADHTLPETDYANNRRDMTLTFNERQDLTILYVPVGYAPPNVNPQLPSNTIRSAYYYAQKMFPLPNDGLHYIRGATKWYHKPLQTVPQQEDFVKWLAKLYAHADLLQTTESYDQLIGWVADGVSGNLGWSDPLWGVPPGSGRATFAMDGWWAGYSMAHEVAHNLGLQHPSTVNNADACNAWDPTTKWPYANATIQEEGFDPLRNGRGEVKASSKKDLMSYCIDWGANSTSPIWISPFSYHRLYEADSQPSLPLAAGRAQQEVAVVSGIIFQTGTATIDPLFRLSTSKALPTSLVGTGYCLEMQNGSGNPLSSTCFDVDFLDNDRNPVNQESFFFTLPFLAGTQSAVLKHGAMTLVTRSASAHAPAVTITAPTAGITWDGAQTIQWTASDEDGDPLEFSLIYSKDGGVSWLPIAAEVTETSFTVDTTEFPGGNQVRLRVLASDGFHTSSADVAPLTVLRKAPQPVILDPEDGAVILPNHPLVLVGGGDDLEDGVLDPSTFSWSSNQVGLLGTGGEVNVAGLPVGDHVITLQARDADSNTGTDTITLHVRMAHDYLPMIWGAAPPQPTPTPTPRPLPTPTPTAAPSGWQTIFADGFEGSFPGAWSLSGSPTWGATGCRPYSGAQSVWPAAAGSGAVTPCVNVYPDNMDSWMSYGPFDLTGASAAEVTFWRWQSTEPGYDYFKWLASVDDQTYYGWQSSGNTNGWNAVTFDLSNVVTLGDLRGRPQVWFAFRMVSDLSNGDQGAFVDDVVIRKRTDGGMAAIAAPFAPSGSADYSPAHERR